MASSLSSRGSLDMCSGPLFGKIVRYTLPIILTSVLQLLFNAADLIVVGQYCGSISVAAVGATGAISNLIITLFIGLSVGAGVAVAVGLGARDDAAVRDAVHTAIPTAFFCGIAITVIGAVGARQFLIWMDTPDDVLDLAAVYMRVYFCGVTGSMLYNFGAAILRAAGDTLRPLIFLTAAGVLNVGLNIFFVVVFDMDVAGVALATSITQALAAVCILVALMRRTDACRLILRDMRIKKEPLRRIVAIGLPAGVQGVMFSISNVIIQSSINSFGSAAMSGNSAANNLDSFVCVSMNALHQSALNFTGQNYGARHYRRIGRIRWICLGCVTVLGLVLGSLMYLAGRPLLAIYITDSPAAIEYGMLRLTFVCLPFFLNGLHDVMTGVIRGMGHSAAPMLISVFGICISRVIWIYTVFRIPEYHNLSFLYLSYPISWILTFLMQTVCCEVLLARLRRQGDEVPETA